MDDKLVNEWTFNPVTRPAVPVSISASNNAHKKSFRLELSACYFNEMIKVISYEMVINIF